MQLNNKLYDALKWITLIALPALGTAYVGFAAIWVWPYADEVSRSVVVIVLLLGALLGLSTATYNKAVPFDGVMKLEPPDPDNPKKDLYSLQLNDDEYNLVDKKFVTFKVVKTSQ